MQLQTWYVSLYWEYGSSIYKIPELSAKLLDKQNFQEFLLKRGVRKVPKTVQNTQTYSTTELKECIYMVAHEMVFKNRDLMHDISIWEWDSEKGTEEVIAVLCINSCKGSNYPGEENIFVLKRNNWVPVSEEGFVQYVKMLTQKTMACFCSCKILLPWAVKIRTRAPGWRCGVCHPLSWEVKNTGFFSCDSLGSFCSLRKKNFIQNRSWTAPELMATSPSGGSCIIWVRWSAFHARVLLLSKWNWEEQRDTSKLKPHSFTDSCSSNK